MNVKIGDTWVSPTSYQQARAMTDNIQANGKVTANNVRNLVQQMFSSWNFSTNTEPFRGSGLKNISIHPQVFRDMADNPEKMVEMLASFKDTIETEATAEAFFRSKQPDVTIVARGVIYNADGSSSSWTMGYSKMGSNEKRSLIEIPKNEKPTWSEIMRRHSEEMLGVKNIGDANQTGKGWLA